MSDKLKIPVLTPYGFTDQLSNLIQDNIESENSFSIKNIQFKTSGSNLIFELLDSNDKILSTSIDISTLTK